MPAIARWNPARDVWELETGSLFCEHLDVWSETFPSSGMWAGGMVYALPTSVPLMDGFESSCSLSLLGTPTGQPESVADPEKRAARVERARAKHGRPFGESLAAQIAGLPKI